MKFLKLYFIITLIVISNILRSLVSKVK